MIGRNERWRLALDVKQVRSHHDPRVGWQCTSSTNHRLADLAGRVIEDDVWEAAQRIVSGHEFRADPMLIARAILGLDVCPACKGAGREVPERSDEGYADREYPRCEPCDGKGWVSA